MCLRGIAALVGCLTVGLAPARAHFIWIDVAPAANGQLQARLYFSEAPEPGEPHLIGKIGHTKAWTRAAGGLPGALKTGKAGDESAALLLEGPVAPTSSLEATCDYGVYQRGPDGLLLQYHAKRLLGEWSRHGETLTRAPRLALDIVPRLEAGKLMLEVLYQGKPSRDSDVVIVDPDGQHQEYSTDDQGRVDVEVAGGGRYAIRAAHIEADETGERDGKSYSQTRHYCTLLVDVPAADTAQASNVDRSAADVLKRARDGRALWGDDFPGYTAELTVSDGQQQVTGRATIDSSGVVELDMPESPLTDWVERQLNSLVQHRMPDGVVSEGDVTFGEGQVSHPLGRLIHLGDADLESAYRIKDDVIMEVNRSAGPTTRFTISVLAIVRNAENKYLPRAFTINFFDTKSGALKTSLGYWNEWHRVGKFDLPKTIIEVNAHPGGTSTRQVVFSKCMLIE